MAITAPITELGSTSGASGALAGLPSWNSLAGGDEAEYNPVLQWPASVRAYKRMLNDAQCQGLYLGLTLPIRGYDFRIDPNGARADAVNALQEDLGLDLVGAEPQPQRRSARRFSFPKHLEDALRAILYGHYFFEQVGEIGEDGLWHLRKLAPRPPSTLSEIATERDGGLKYIRQQTGPTDPPIGVERLVAYVWDLEGANWTGRSMFRSAYGPWLIKDRILRVGAINIERAGGVPYVEAPPGASADVIQSLDRLAQNFKVGESSGGAIPHGAQLKLAQAAGGDGAVGYINLMNEEMARSFLLMLIQLGQTQTGSRALGGEFSNVADVVQQTICGWALDVFNEHVIEDWMEWNYGEGEMYAPLLVVEPDAPMPDPLSGFAEQLDEGNLQVEPNGEAAELLTAARKPSVSGRRRRKRAEAADATSPALPPRPLRRQPYNHEITAAVDWATMDSTWETTRAALVAAYRNARRVQIDELADAVVEADGDLKKLARLAAEPTATELVEQAMGTIAAAGVEQALSEAISQGAPGTRPDLDTIVKELAQRASAVTALLARDISNAAVRHAIRLTGGSLPPADAAAQVRVQLNGLSDSYLEERLGGALTAAQNTGRKLAMGRNSPRRVYSSELLDSATCSKCSAKDGTEYLSLGDAEQDYPTGGYKDCEGFERCRGTLVAVYGEGL